MISILILALLLIIVALLAFENVQDVLLEMLQEGSIGVAASVLRFDLILALVIDLRRLFAFAALKELSILFHSRNGLVVSMLL